MSSQRKYPSGAEKRKKRRERDLKELDQEAIRRGFGGLEKTTENKVETRVEESEKPRQIKKKKNKLEIEDDECGERPDLEPYRALGGVPEDVTQLVSWAARAAGLLLSETLVDPTLTANERRRTGADLVAKIGLVFPKAQLQAQVKALSIQLDRAGDVPLAPESMKAKSETPEPPKKKKALRVS